MSRICLIYIPVSWKCRKFWIKTRSILLEIAFLNFEVQNPKFGNLSLPFSTVRYFMSRGIFTFILFLKCVWQLHKLVLFFCRFNYAWWRDKIGHMTHISKFSDGLTIFTDDIKLMTKNDAKTTVIIQSSTHIWKIYQNKQVFRLGIC